MPVLMDKGRRKVQCFNCKKQGHVRKECEEAGVQDLRQPGAS